jgi:hypothetical protein
MPQNHVGIPSHQIMENSFIQKNLIVGQIPTGGNPSFSGKILTRGKPYFSGQIPTRGKPSFSGKIPTGGNLPSVEKSQLRDNHLLIDKS